MNDEQRAHLDHTVNLAFDRIRLALAANEASGRAFGAYTWCEQEDLDTYSVKARQARTTADDAEADMWAAIYDHLGALHQVHCPHDSVTATSCLDCAADLTGGQL